MARQQASRPLQYLDVVLKQAMKQGKPTSIIPYDNIVSYIMDSTPLLRTFHSSRQEMSTVYSTSRKISTQFAPQEYNIARFRWCDEWCAFGIVILLYVDKGVPVAHRLTKRSPLPVWTGQKWVSKKVEYFNRSPTLMTSFLFCFKTYIKQIRNLEAW